MGMMGECRQGLKAGTHISERETGLLRCRCSRLGVLERLRRCGSTIMTQVPYTYAAIVTSGRECVITIGVEVEVSDAGPVDVL